MSNIKIKLGDSDFSIPKMNIGQIEDLVCLEVPPMKWPFAALAIMVRRAEPAIADIREVDASHEQISEAVEKIMKHSGYALPKSDKDADPKNRKAPARNGAAS